MNRGIGAASNGGKSRCMAADSGFLDVFIPGRFDAPPRKSCIVRDQSLCIFDDDLKLLGWMKYCPDAAFGSDASNALRKSDVLENTRLREP